ncbi:hypothetical protein GGR66_004251, partial [Xanthomonas sp. 3498]|nr:hypothetical protein [Xanthomonas sp. 3498]
MRPALLLLLLLLLIYRGPLGAAATAGEYPKGDAQDARRFSPAHGCAVE